jgi:hypothetical protein
VHTNAFFPLYLTLYLGQLFLVPLVAEEQLGVSLVREYALPCRVGRHIQIPLLSVLTEVSSFGQYIYGIYLGFNGEIPLEVRSILISVC